MSILRFFFVSFVVFGCLFFSNSYAQNTFTYEVDSLKESANQPLSLEEVKQMFAMGKGADSENGLLTLGIGTHAGWVRIRVNNPTEHIITQRLTTGVTWINYLDLYQIHDSGVVKKWSAGDAFARTKEILPSVGIVFNVSLPIGESEFYIRAQANDPIVMPIQFLSLDDVADHDLLAGILYGVMYGILLTLLGYNIILYHSLKQTRFAFYSVYIGSFIIMNTGYNGFLFSWMHPNNSQLQNYLTLNIMVVHSILGLLFTMKFLDVKRYRPKLFSFVLPYMGIGIFSIVISTLFQWHFFAAFFAFTYLAITTLVMVLLGVLHLNIVERANYFLLAVTASMIGLFITVATNAGVVPFTYFGYHAAEFGVLLEAIVLAFILSADLKMKENERLKAEYLAAFDPLTNLLNRRSFFALASQKINRFKAEGIPLSIVVMDIDHFKKVNDTYGHHVGDEALIHVATILKENTRKDDLIGRYGGEELVILLPKDDCKRASLFTERLRIVLQQTPLETGGMTVNLTASFGVVELKDKVSLDEMLKQADVLLYQAKKNGRNQVVSAIFPEGAVN
ncbi:diguanylate cyclase [Shewanella sp. Isolate11]|uniref:sensor domain-containing diguanylate cyclase n=1 Tax=Shewanella sp. Isolate11 TaxID=2908530 RepID=UPI001EFE79A0|nr:diguanylate cyclase [Shewanella sp. Isolate11]MCG9697701.1 sensor domain-containing diguanylate cyclase [Shewanella sp. Isolate11]